MNTQNNPATNRSLKNYQPLPKDYHSSESERAKRVNLSQSEAMGKDHMNPQRILSPPCPRQISPAELQFITKIIPNLIP